MLSALHGEDLCGEKRKSSTQRGKKRQSETPIANGDLEGEPEAVDEPVQEGHFGNEKYEMEIGEAVDDFNVCKNLPHGQESSCDDLFSDSNSDTSDEGEGSINTFAWPSEMLHSSAPIQRRPRLRSSYFQNIRNKERTKHGLNRGELEQADSSDREEGERNEVEEWTRRRVGTSNDGAGRQAGRDREDKAGGDNEDGAGQRAGEASEDGAGWRPGGPSEEGAGRQGGGASDSGPGAGTSNERGGEVGDRWVLEDWRRACNDTAA